MLCCTLCTGVLSSSLTLTQLSHRQRASPDHMFETRHKAELASKPALALTEQHTAHFLLPVTVSLTY